jgi:hypothetical protein
MQDSALLQNIINQSIFSYKFDVPKNKMKKTKHNNRLNSEYTGDDHASNYKDIINNISKLIIYKYINIDVPKFDLDLNILKYDLPLPEVLKHLRENNKFLFEETNEEKNLTDKLKIFQVDTEELKYT